MYVPLALTKRAEIDAAIQRVQHAVGSDVLRIRYEIEQDWTGQWAIFFRIVLTDEAAKRRLRDIADNLVWRLEREIDFPALGVLSYHNFRSESEQTVLQEPAWA